MREIEISLRLIENAAHYLNHLFIPFHFVFSFRQLFSAPLMRLKFQLSSLFIFVFSHFILVSGTHVMGFAETRWSVPEVYNSKNPRSG